MRTQAHEGRTLAPHVSQTRLALLERKNYNNNRSALRSASASLEPEQMDIQSNSRSIQFCATGAFRNKIRRSTAKHSSSPVLNRALHPTENNTSHARGRDATHSRPLLSLLCYRQESCRPGAFPFCENPRQLPTTNNDTFQRMVDHAREQWRGTKPLLTNNPPLESPSMNMTLWRISCGKITRQKNHGGGGGGFHVSRRYTHPRGCVCR